MCKPQKALILAAGFGSRLAPLTDHLPKSLVPVCGKPILFQQIDALHENGITDITVISGYCAQVLEQAVHSRWPEIRVLESVDYASTNNMYSALLGSQAVEGGSFLMMNADVFFDASVIRALLAFDGPDAIVTDLGRYLEESMKVVEEDGRLVHISKAVPPEEALGASIDVYKFSAAGGRAFFDACRDYIEVRGEKKLWSEVALDRVLGAGHPPFRACPLEGRWLEIDNHEDLAAAEALFGGEKA